MIGNAREICDAFNEDATMWLHPSPVAQVFHYNIVSKSTVREKEMQDFVLTILSLLLYIFLKVADYCYDPDRV